ncbi:hypothetical protein CBR_g45565 [Chara braunii]|uniref:Uncharacterized protein n=1 Tax=Chara braunii TaxID=69332 RepID=A0A388LYX8_CHABU|nr:hypothetical protein CBR_g45565 [Chara braunii]|eukprot:GBG87506.1 hypothetical protein CBR_g45565 [Chara braunii]
MGQDNTIEQVEQRLRKTEFVRSEEPCAVLDEALHDAAEDTLPETAGMPLPEGSVDGVVHMSLGQEDIQAGQPVAFDDIRLPTEPGGIAPTTGGREDIEGAAYVRGLEERVQGDLVATVGEGPHVKVNSAAGHIEEAIDRHGRDKEEASRTLVVHTAVGPEVPHQTPFPVDPRRCAHDVVPVVKRCVGKGMFAPPLPPFAPSCERTQSRYVPQSQGTLAFGCMTAEELEGHSGTDYTEIDTRMFMGSLPTGIIASCTGLV